MCPCLWYLLAAAAVQPLLLHCVCPCVCHLFTLSIPSSLCPCLIQGQLRVWHTWPGEAHVLLWHSQGRRGTPRTEPSLLHCHPPWGTTTHNTSPQWKQRTQSVLCCPVLTMEGGVEPSGTSHLYGGTPYHKATFLKFTVSHSENHSTLSTVNVKY